MAVLPPGTLLQLMYLRERLQHIKPGRFIEIGPGSGEITRLLLDLGWTGLSYDLEAVTVGRLQMRFARDIDQGRYSAVNADYLSPPRQPGSADLVISCMVMEHLEDASESAFIQKSSEILSPDGLMIGLVPSSPAHWGIEDDIAGHCRRYTRTGIRELLEKNKWHIEHLAGLTFPVSNFLQPISNYLVCRSEKSKLNLSQLERTKQSGLRSIKFKTHFPSVFVLLLNRCTLWPWYQLQKVFADHESAMVLYFEAKPDSGVS